MQAYKEYKETGLAWLERIPKHWTVVRNKNFLTEITIKNEDEQANLLGVSQYTGVTEKKNATNMQGSKKSESLVGYKCVKEHQLVINIMLTWNGSLGISRYIGVVSPAYAVFDIANEVNPWFIHYLFRCPHLTKYFKGYSTGVIESRLRLYPETLFQLFSVLPPREEQDKIVQFLDHKLEKIHKFIATKQKLIALLEEQKQAIINQAVTKGLDLNAPMKDSGIDWLGEVPKHWEVEKLKRFCKVNASISHLIQGIKDDEPLVFLPMEKVSTNGVIDCSERRSFKSIKTGFSSFAKNDVVVAKITPCFENGKGAYLDKLETAVGYGTTEFITLRPNEKMLGSYLYLITSCKYFRLQGEDKMTGSAGQKRVPSDFIAQFTLGIPDIKEQEKIIKFVNVQTQKIKSVMDKTQKEIDLIQEYKTSLISSVVTGEIDVICFTY